MVTKRTPPARRRRTTTKKSPSNWFGRFVLICTVLGLTLVAGWFYFSLQSLNLSGTTKEWVETVLLAADVDLKKDVVIVDRDETERWKITLPSEKKKAAILRALTKGVKARAGKLEPGQNIRRDGRTYHVVELEKDNGEPLRLIFEVVKPEKPRPRPPPKQVPTTLPVVENQPPATSLPNLAAVESAEATNAASNKRRIAVILDDIGQENVESLRSVLDLKFPITFAVLPYLGQSRSCAYYLHQHQYEVMLHMPMEPESYPRADPGVGAIHSYHNATEIRTAVNNALEAVPFVTGVNNHMGSKVTASRNLMRPVLDELKDRGLFFIDSRTQSNTVAFHMARDLGLRAGRRDVFLDSEMSYDFALKQLQEARKVADEQGFAIVIGHPYPSSLRALKDMMPAMDEDGYRFVFASELVKVYHDQL